MESEWEREIRELLDSLAREPLEDLLKEIAETPQSHLAGDRSLLTLPYCLIGETFNDWRKSFI